MAKKKRKPHKKPMRTPLSKLDKLVYNVAIVASVVLCFGSILIFLLISSNIAFADPAVIAVHWEGFHVLYQVPIMVFFAVLAVFFSVLQSPATHVISLGLPVASEAGREGVRK